MAPRGTYLQIADSLRSAVESGDLPVGAMLPSERELGELHRVSRGTVRAALALLEKEGLIESVPGRGRRVGTQMSLPGTGAAYERIADALMSRLEAGEFSPGVQLPSESELIAQHRVSRNTVRRAYRRLVDLGVVEVRQGAGAFVRRR